MGRIVEYPPEQADEIFDEVPEPGDEINYNGEECIIQAIDIINDSCLCLKIIRKREKKRVDDPFHDSATWEVLPERFLDTGPEENFINQGSFK
jgi:hypothetical protein